MMTSSFTAAAAASADDHSSWVPADLGEDRRDLGQDDDSNVSSWLLPLTVCCGILTVGLLAYAVYVRRFGGPVSTRPQVNQAVRSSVYGIEYCVRTALEISFDLS